MTAEVSALLERDHTFVVLMIVFFIGFGLATIVFRKRE